MFNFKIQSSTIDISKIDLNKIERQFDSLLNDPSVGYTQLPYRDHLWKTTEQLGQNLRDNYNQLVIVGMGGSSMGPRCLTEIFRVNNILFLDNVDSAEFDHCLSQLTDLKKTAWIFISKSGTTIEVLTNFEFAEQHYQENKINFIQNCYFISEPVDNSLTNLAQANKRPCLEIPVDVGGRFSVLSPVGGVVVSFAGKSLEEFKSGAIEALTSKKEIVTTVASYLASFEKNLSLSVFWFYSSSCRWFGSWLQQLWAESLGKQVNKFGTKSLANFSTPLTLIGSCDQHSVLQQIMDGTKDKFVTFFTFSTSEVSTRKLLKNSFSETSALLNKDYGSLIKAQAESTQLALNQKQIETITLRFGRLNEKTMGFLFMYYQIVVSLIADYHNINAYDQPGVALGKQLTLDKLNEVIGSTD